jgi:hypothetical protein
MLSDAQAACFLATLPLTDIPHTSTGFSLNAMVDMVFFDDRIQAQSEETVTQTLCPIDNHTID